MDATSLAKLVTVLCLIVIFVAAVLVTPRIWHSHEIPKRSEDPEKPGRTGSSG